MTAACAACIAAPAAVEIAAPASPTREVLLALPNIHCAGCIKSVESALSAAQGVARARVNLSRRTAAVEAEEWVAPEALIDALARAGHQAVEMNAEAVAKSGDQTARQLLIYVAIAGFAMMNVMLLSVSVWAGADAAMRDFLHWISAALALPTLAIVGRPFYSSAFSALKAGRLNMDVPISLALILAAGLSLYETIHGGPEAYFDAALALAFFLLVGRYLERRARHLAHSAASDLAALETPFAYRLTSQGPEKTPIDQIRVGDALLIPAGERCPVDALAGDEGGVFDISHLTGESQPMHVKPGEEIAAGALCLGGAVSVTASAVGVDTSLRRMLRLVEAVERGGGRYATLSDRAARIYAPGVHLIALLTLIGWIWQTGDIRQAIFAAIATLIITCPCALGLAAPAVAASAMSKAFRNGVLLKSGSALERVAEIDTVVLDKTGTIEAPEPAVETSLSDDDLMRACAIAQGSRHPYSRALLGEAANRDLAVVAAAKTEETAGAGVSGVLDGQRIRLGSAAFVGAEPGAGLETWLQIDDRPPQRIAFTSKPREGAAQMIRDLKALGLDVRLLSGDRPEAVAACANRINVDKWVAAATPEEKLRLLQDLQDEGRKVLMIGDGINDVGAMASAHVSAAMASGLEAARSRADIVLMRADLGNIAPLIRTARAARRRTLENFSVAAVYNAVSIPIAIAGFASPLAAALAMSTSSILVALNALRIK